MWFRNAQKKVQSSFGSTSPRTTLSGSPTNTGSGFLGGIAVERSLKQLVDPTLISSFSNLSIGNSNAAYFASDANDKQLQGEVVTREHWQRESGQDICSSPGCGKALGRLGVGKRHCSQYVWSFILNGKEMYPPNHAVSYAFIIADAGNYFVNNIHSMRSNWTRLHATIQRTESGVEFVSDASLADLATWTIRVQQEI